MTLFKLSLRNARRQARDYLVYFVTVIMAAAMVYAFNGLVFSQEIRSLSSMMDSLPLVIVLASVVAVCIIGWLIQYTTGFMLTCRSRELGTYILIGLENRQVAKLFFMENLAVGVVALMLGTFLGNLIFQALRAIMLALFHVSYTFVFSFSVQAVGLTLFYFALVYLFALFKSRAKQTTCFDLFIATASQDEDRFDGYLAYIDKNIPVRSSYQYNIYQDADFQVSGYIGANTDYRIDFDYDTLMKASDYAALRAMLGYPPVSLEPGKYRIHCMRHLQNLLTNYGEPLNVGGYSLTPGGVCSEDFTQYLWDGNGSGFVLVVPDEAVENCPVSHSIYAAMTPEPLRTVHFDALRGIRDQNGVSSQDYDTLFSKAAAEEESAAMYAVIVFPLYYLALVLTMVSATILTIHQLSETERYRRQFALLEKLGMDRQEMKQTLRRQFAVDFRKEYKKVSYKI